MKKTIALLLALILAMSLFGCGSKQTPSSEDGEKQPSEVETVKYPDGKTISIMVGYGAGGVNDLACRVIAPYLAKELDTNVEVVNMPGAGGWVQILDLINNTEPDGYTIGIYADGMQMSRHSAGAHYDEGMDDMTLLCSYASDTCSLACKPDETRWTDIASLIEYAKNNVVTVSVTALEGEDSIPVAMMNSQLGTKFELVLAVDGATQGIANVMGGHVDIVSDNIAALNNNVQDGSLKALCVFSEEESPMWEGVPTFKEATGVEIYFQNTRGFSAPAGMDPAVLEILSNALEAAVTNPDCIAELNALGLNNAYLNGEEFYERCAETEEMAMGVAKSLGWDWY